MPSSQITATPVVIQQAWNDGLFNLRERRNGVARGTSIEEKVMYVLGLGWKYRGTSEIKDAEVENTLYVSLQGLTQESKFLKIGQVLWEQCDEQFILKMISTLSNNTPQQTRIYNQIALREQKNFKGYFSKAAMKSISRNDLSGNAILNRESKQLYTNTQTTQKNRANVDAERKRLQYNELNSKKFDRRVVRFQPSNPEIRQLTEELTIILRTIESNNIGPIAMSLGINVESGFNKKYLTEEIIQVVATYVEKELMFSRSGSNKASSNVYLRQGPDGLATIKRLLKFTHYGLMVSNDDLSIDDLKGLDTDIARMRANMALGQKRDKGDFSLKRMDKAIRKKDAFLGKVTTREGNSSSSALGEKIKRSQAKSIYDFLSSQIGGGASGNFKFIRGNRGTPDEKFDEDAVGA